MSDNNWQTFDLNELRKQLAGNKVEYREFLNVPSLSCGIYHLPAGSRGLKNFLSKVEQLAQGAPVHTRFCRLEQDRII